MPGHISFDERPELLEEVESFDFRGDGEAKEYHARGGQKAAEDQLAEVLVGGENDSLLLCRQMEDTAVGQSRFEDLGVKDVVAQTLEVGNDGVADVGVGE
jgi:hypothetical protein